MKAYNGSDDDNMVFIKLKCVYWFTEQIREGYLELFCLIEKKIQNFKIK